jgi:hypothetical protein
MQQQLLPLLFYCLYQEVLHCLVQLMSGGGLL